MLALAALGALGLAAGPSPIARSQLRGVPRARAMMESSTPPAFDGQQLLQEGREVLLEALGIVREVGLESTVRRTLVGQQAVLQTALELARELPRAAFPPPAGMTLDRFLLDYIGQLPPELAPRTLRKLFERLGATYVKLGQFIASSPTLFPADYVLEFQKCLDSSPTVDFATIEKIVVQDLGKPLDEVFASFDRTALASASVAQVHAATLLSGEDVVVKVQKPGTRDVLQADLGFLAVAARVLQFVAPGLGRLSLSPIVNDLRTTMLGELDFRQEAQNLVEFAGFLRESGLEGIATCPRPYPAVSGARVLTMERLYGLPLTDLDGIRAYTNNPEQTLINALNTWTLSVVASPFFHADVHAGNLLVLKDGRVGFIDFGIVGRIPPATWTAVQALGGGLVQSDWTMVAHAMVDMGATKDAVDIQQLARDIETIDPQLIATVSEGEVRTQVTVDNQAVTKLTLEIAEVAERAGVKLPREFGLLIKQALYFDRYTKLLAPDLDVMSDTRVRLGGTGGAIDVQAR
ncbi:ABC1 family-domain-containing protein [Pavlovales sp. CCMP2436]|nr:ABC1 family-domain-containing protein [Pavlovales sp. CCMP2436]